MKEKLSRYAVLTVATVFLGLFLVIPSFYILSFICIALDVDPEFKRLGIVSAIVALAVSAGIIKKFAIKNHLEAGQG